MGKRRAKIKANKIPLPFEKAVEGLLSVQPKKKTKKKKGPASNWMACGGMAQIGFVKYIVPNRKYQIKNMSRAKSRDRKRPAKVSAVCFFARPSAGNS